jgi:N-acylneuraminate cytidylyltransferase
MKKVKYAVLIPARGGSKGIPNKNLVEIGGKPLIAWSILAARKNFTKEEIFVSTDSTEIMEIAKQFGAQVPFLRPRHLSTDVASTESVALHFLEWLHESGIELDSLVLMQATSPIRSGVSLSEAVQLFESESADSLVTVCKTHKFIWENLSNPQANYDIYNRPRRQDIPKNDEIYFENGSFYITKTKVFKEFKNRLGGKIVMYEMTAEESFEIDDKFDLEINKILIDRHFCDDNN